MAREIIRTPEGELVYAEINPVSGREGVDVEEFERMAGFPHKTQKMQRSFPTSSGDSEPPIDEEEAEELYLLAYQGREALERYPRDEYFNIVEDWAGNEYDQPLDELHERLNETYGETGIIDESQTLIELLGKETETDRGDLFGRYGWTETEFMNSLKAVSTFMSYTVGLDREEARENSESIQEDLEMYIDEARNLEKLMYDFQKFV